MPRSPRLRGSDRALAGAVGGAVDAAVWLRLVQESAGIGAWQWDLTADRLTVDRACAGMLGLTPAQVDDAAVTERIHPGDLPAVRDALRQAALGAGQVDVEFRTLRPGEPSRHLLARGHAQLGSGDQVKWVLGALLDVTEPRAAADAEAVAARQLTNLAEVAVELAGVETVEALSAVVIERGLQAAGADGGAVAVSDPDAGLLRLAVASSLGEDAGREYGEVPLDGPLPMSRAARTGRPVLLPDVGRTPGGDAPELGRLLDATGRGALAALPLRAGGRLLGSMLATWEQPRDFPPDEVRMLTVLAAQCSQALDRIQVRTVERARATAARRLSETLQRSMLTDPPEPDHLEIAVRYLPAAQEAQVGGDWYDAFLSPDGGTTLVVGDVAGHDRDAAAVMGQVRNLLRGVAYSLEKPPAAVLSGLDRALQGLAVHTLATAVLARVEQTDELAAAGLRRLRWSSAGHPPPLLVHPDGSAELLDQPPDLLLGLDPATPRSDHELTLPPGSVVLLYTDGLVERRGEAIDDGLERLRAATARLHACTLGELCDTLVAELAADPDDDVALVALRLHPEDRPRPVEAGPQVLPPGFD